MAWVSERLAGGGASHRIALGDSPNDLPLLNRADTAVIIHSPSAAIMTVAGAGRIIRSQQAGPRGWQEVMAGLLREPALNNKET